MNGCSFVLTKENITKSKKIFFPGSYLLVFGNKTYFAGFFNAKAASKNDHYECSLSNDSSRSFSRDDEVFCFFCAGVSHDETSC